MATSKSSTDKSKEEKNLWSGDVTEHEKWHSPEGLFKESPKEIAKTLKENSNSERQAISRVTFYENRAGSNLSDDDRERLDKAKEEIRKAYAKDKPKE